MLTRIFAVRKAVEPPAAYNEVVNLNLQEDPTVFGYIIDWAVLRRLECEPPRNIQTKEVNNKQLVLFCDIYDCSDRIGMSNISLELLPKIKSCLGDDPSGLPDPDVLAFIYSNTLINGPVQKVIGKKVLKAVENSTEEEVSNMILDWVEVIKCHVTFTKQFAQSVWRRKNSEPKVDARKRKAANISGQPSQRPAPKIPRPNVVDLMSSSSEGSTRGGLDL